MSIGGYKRVGEPRTRVSSSRGHPFLMRFHLDSKLEVGVLSDVSTKPRLAEGFRTKTLGRREFQCDASAAIRQPNWLPFEPFRARFAGLNSAWERAFPAALVGPS